MRKVNAHYDGKAIVLDEPVDLEPNTQVHVIVPDFGEAGVEMIDSCARLSESTFRKVWDNDLDTDYDKL